MSSDDNVKTIDAVYEAFGRGDVAAILDVLTDDVDFAAEASATDVPWWGVRHGKEGAADFFAQLAATCQVLEFTPLVVIGGGDDVLTLVRYRAKVERTGRTVDMEIHHHFHFRDGKIDRYRGSEDTLQTQRAFAA